MVIENLHKQRSHKIPPNSATFLIRTNKRTRSLQGPNFLLFFQRPDSDDSRDIRSRQLISQETDSLALIRAGEDLLELEILRDVPQADGLIGRRTRELRSTSSLLPYIFSILAHTEVGNPLQVSLELLHQLSVQVPDLDHVVPATREDHRVRRGVAERDAGNHAVMRRLDREQGVVLLIDSVDVQSVIVSHTGHVEAVVEVVGERDVQHHARVVFDLVRAAFLQRLGAVVHEALHLQLGEDVDHHASLE